MKLDRNIPGLNRGKYALIKLRIDQPVFSGNPEPPDGRNMRVSSKAVDFGNTIDSDFFVIRLKDKYAEPALRAYAEAADADGQWEYADEILELAHRARHHPRKQEPS